MVEEKYHPLDYFRSLVYPDRCALCDEPVPFRSHICTDCRRNVEVIRDDICIKCGLPEKECFCKGRSRACKGIVAPFRYEGVVRKGIHRWKYHEYAHNNDFFAEMIAAAVKMHYADIDFDFVTFIPQTEDEIAEKGFNQGEILATTVASKLNLPIEDVLVKLFDSPRQHKTPNIFKRGNVAGIFDCKNTEIIRNRKILLVDDVKTSGSTVNECAKMLRLYDAADVYCAVIAVAVSEKG